MQTNRLIAFKCSESSFCEAWLEFLTPYHHLTAKEKKVAALIFNQYFRLSKDISDPSVLNEVMWTCSSRKDMRDAAGVSKEHFQMILAKLKKAKVLNEDLSINIRFLPNKKPRDSRFVLSIVFDWSTKTNLIDVSQQA